MANVKKISAPWNQTGKTAYAIIRREADSYRLNAADGTFAANPTNPYLALTEDAVIKGLYEVLESRTAWNDGSYLFAAYIQSGGSPAPASDTPISFGYFNTIGDVQITLDASVASRSTQAAVSAIPTNPLLSTDTRLNNLDAAISSRSTYAGGAVASVTAPVTVGINNDKSGYSGVATNMVVAPDNTSIAAIKVKTDNLPASPAAVSDIPTTVAIATAVWGAATRTLTGFGTLVSDVSAAVWSATTRTLSAFGFNVTASSVMDKSGYSLATPPPAASDIRAEMDANSTKLANLDATISSRLATSGYTAPDNTSVAAIKAKTDQLQFTGGAVQANATATVDTSAVATAVWDAQMANHETSGSTGEVLSKLIIPGYAGPEIVIPAPVAPNLQTLYGNVKEFASTAWAVGDVVTLTIKPNQAANGSVISPAPRSFTIGTDGLFDFTADIGADVVITVSNTSGVYFKKEFTVSTDPVKNIADYTDAKPLLIPFT